VARGGDDRDNFTNLFRQLIEDQVMDRPLLEALHRRTDSMVTKLQSDGWIVLQLEAEAMSRLRTGAGGDTPLQGELERDHLSGWPNLPASGLRGSITNDSDEESEVDDDAHQAEPARWKLFSALPMLPAIVADPIPCKVIADVFTPHTSDWHMNDGLPNRWESPIPVPVMSIERGARFRIVMAAESKYESELEKASEALTEALLLEGFGARTTRGMGYFSTKHITAGAEMTTHKVVQNK
jgi:CRISPR/Cas system CMR subunit Cmr6 (Cas7 group RAMP superfamily)